MEGLRVKGNSSEKALLKFAIDNFPEELNILLRTNIEILQWSSFNPNRKRSTLVMKYKHINEDQDKDKKHSHQNYGSLSDGSMTRKNLDRESIYVYIKGQPKAVIDLCTYFFADTDETTQKMTEDDMIEVENIENELYNRNLKVITFAMRKLT
jgi:magnesium-transporting ATPase (P-type)